MIKTFISLNIFTFSLPIYPPLSGHFALILDSTLNNKQEKELLLT